MPSSPSSASGSSLPPRPSPPPTTHYELLQLPRTATAQELRQAFRRLSKHYHPDTTRLPLAEAEEAFQQLKTAYSVLSDPARRRAYDAQLSPPAAAPGAVVRRRGGASGPPAPSRPASVRRSLSGGEWFALLLLALAFLFSLSLGLGLAWARGAELMHRPSWMTERPLQQLPATAPPDSVPPHVPSDLSREGNAPVPPLPHRSGELAEGPGSPAAGTSRLDLGSAPAPVERPAGTGERGAEGELAP